MLRVSQQEDIYEFLASSDMTDWFDSQPSVVREECDRKERLQNAMINQKLSLEQAGESFRG